MADIWIVGGSGRTGRGIAAELVSRGHSPVLLGRSAARLADAAGDLRTMTVRGVEDIAVRVRAEHPAAVVNTVGPFTESAAPLTEACLSGSDYVDLSNDLAGVLTVLDRHDAAERAGRTFVTAAGFGGAVTESVVVRLCQERSAPARVRVDMVPSVAVQAGQLGDALAGTIVEGAPGVPGGGRYDSRRYANGRLVRSRLAGDVTTLTLPDGSRVRTGGMPLGELVAAQRASGAPTVLSASSEAPTAAAVRAVLPLATRLLAIPAVRRSLRRRLAAVQGKARPRPREYSWGHAVLEWPDGDRREGWVRVGEAMGFTSAIAAEITHRLVAGAGKPGAYTPAALFGPSLVQACGGEYLLGVGRG